MDSHFLRHVNFEPFEAFHQKLFKIGCTFEQVAFLAWTLDMAYKGIEETIDLSIFFGRKAYESETN